MHNKIVMPGIFTFGIPNHFNFTFRAGLKPDNSNSDASSEAKTLVLSPSRGMGNTDSCGILTRLSLEIRIMVYTNVLKSERIIRQAHNFLGRHPPIMAADARHLEAIDSALLRTCRTIYREAIRVLYGTNRFRFRSPSEIHEFAHVGMTTTPFGFYCTASGPSSAVRNAPCGRLTMIRSLTLRISSGSIGGDRKEIWSSWCDFFYPPEGQDQSVGFPALEHLTLDFGDWDLDAGNASKLRVSGPYFPHYMRPFASTSRVPPRSASLVVSGTVGRRPHTNVLPDSSES